MPINTIHPEYKLREEEWQRNRDALGGERAVRARGVDYLPAPPGMSTGKPGEFLEGGKRVGTSRYAHYQSFAEFPEIVEPALNGFQGIIHCKEPKIELPEQMEYLLKDATVNGDTLKELWQTMTRYILSGSRIGLLCDVGEEDDKIRFATYSVENIINWRLGPKRSGEKPLFVVLRECREVSADDDPFRASRVTYYRELRVIDGTYRSRLVEDREGRFVQVGPWEEISYFGKPFEEIPFLSVNVLDTGFEYGAVPLSPLTKRALRIYRLTADYYRSLYIKSDPQIVLSGVMDEDVPTEIGGGGPWNFPNTDAKATYLDIDGKGIPLQREAINDQYTRFWEEGARLLQAGDGASESGKALQRREQAKQVTLRNVVINAANALQKTLRKIAEVYGINPEMVVFKPDLDFASPSISGQLAFEWAQAKNAGFPISDEELHAIGVRGGATEYSYEETLAAMTEDAPTELPPPRVPNLDNRNATPEAPNEDGENGDGS